MPASIISLLIGLLAGGAIGYLAAKLRNKSGGNDSALLDDYKKQLEAERGKTENSIKLTAELNPLLKYFRVQELKVPTLYVMGEEDYLFLAAVRKVVAGHSFSSLQVIANCGHVVNVQAPDQFNTLTIDYIKGV